MLQRGPKGPRATRSSGRTESGRTPNRGGIQKHPKPPVRMDGDGDLVMSGSPATRGASGSGRGGRNARRGRNDFHNQRGATHDISTGIDPRAIQQAIAKSLDSHGSSRGSRNSVKVPRKGSSKFDTREGLDEISVIGLNDSVAAKNPGGGSSELIAWLEHKASKAAPEGEIVKIKKVCLTLHATR